MELSFSMELSFPFDPIKRAGEVENLVMRNSARLYHRFRPAPYYGGIATADAIGCTFLCAYCWNYHRNLDPERFGRFYSPGEVASNLLKIAHKKHFSFLRITGSEPILGEASLKHLTEVIKIIYEARPRSRFVVETNGLLLGYKTELIKSLKFPNLWVRVAIKGVDESSFELITGVKREFFIYPIKAVRELQREDIEAWPAVMGDLFTDSELKDLRNILKKEDIKGDMELESLERYPSALSNMEKRGVAIKR